ncbi:MAG: molybdopterin-dependent oxidoreductase [Thermoplasmata archaeon]
MQFFSACPKDCYDSCSIITKVEDKINIYGNREHPITSGFLCLKSKHFVEAHLTENRLKKSLMRIGDRGDGKFKEIGLDTALNIVAERFKFILKKYGPDHILPIEYAGNKSLISYNFPHRLFNSLGTLKLNHSVCDESGGFALNDLIGTSTGLDPEDIKKSDLIVYWGINPTWTNIHGWVMAKNSKAKIYVIDPLKTESAKGADRHLMLKIGSDIHLIYGLLNLLSKSGQDIDKFEKIVKEFDIKKTSELTGLSENLIKEFADDLMNSKCPIIHMGYGFQRSKYGGLTIKAIETLLIFMQKPRNFIYNAEHNIDYEYLRGKNNNRISVNQANLGRELERLDVKLIFIYNTNPLVSLPNQNLLRKVLLEKDIFIVVHDLFLTDTARFADVVIPAESFFEYNDLVDSYYHDYLNLNQKIFDPPGDAISNHDLFVKLARKLNIEDDYLYESEDDIIKKILISLNINNEEIYKNGFARIQRKVDELKFNLDELYKELIEYKPEEKGHFRLLSLTHIQGITSQHNNLYDYDTSVRMNVDDAKYYSIKNGDEIILENEYGSIKTSVKTDKSIPKGVLLIYKGSWPSIYGWNVNFVVSDDVQKDYANGTALNSTFVNIRVP